MTNLLYNNYRWSWKIPLLVLRRKNKYSETDLANRASISRMTYRNLERQSNNLTLDSLASVTKALGRQLEVLMVPEEEPLSDYSSIAISMKVMKDGFDSWKTHYMEMVDAFRRTLDPTLLLLPPSNELPLKLKALLASIVLHLSDEANISAPKWAAKRYFLEQPWFVSGIDSLKASAILESPVFYRLNNIYVLENFLIRV